MGEEDCDETFAAGVVSGVLTAGVKILTMEFETFLWNINEPFWCLLQVSAFGALKSSEFLVNGW